MRPLRFTPELLTRPRPRGIDVVTTLRHFAIVTYAVDPERLRPHLHPRFVPDEVDLASRGRVALLSVVPFFDVDFRLAAWPSPRFSFGQTNYRAYVRDTETDRAVAWFFGTCLDSWSVAVPRHLWRLPWHRGRIELDCEYARAEGRYARYALGTESAWAPAELELEDTGEPPAALDGFADLETGLVLLTHPLEGYYHRRDGRLGTYRVWHDRLVMTRGRCRRARFPLLDRLGLVAPAEQAAPHSVLLQPETEFTIYLPPRRS